MNSNEKLNILVAYPYMDKRTIELLSANKDRVRFLLDSGAFTAWKAGKEIKLDDYCKFIESLPFAPWRYFTLDKIGDPEGSMENYQTMLSRGFNPVPIFTRGESIEALDEYYKTSDVVGIGGLVGTDKNRGFVNGVMKHVGNRKAHWLGFTRPDYIKHYRPFMCDSSNYSRGSRFGIVDLYYGNGDIKPITRADAHKKITPEIARKYKNYGFDLYELIKPEGWRKSKIITEIGTWSYVEFSMDCEKHLGTHLFLAMSGASTITLALEAHNSLTKQRK